tara:strand:+ start:12605 stop:13099 length:495 start_codon:yes stop_codon:yes gene_type:complete
MSNNFQEKLKIGENFESNYVLPLLLDMHPGYWIESTHDYKTGQYAGPRVQTSGKQPLILPDFKLFNPHNSHSVMYEAKYKAKAFSITGFIGKKFVAIEASKVKDYNNVARLFRSDLKYVIGCGETGKIYFCDASAWVPHYFDNKYYTGDVCAFELKDEDVVSNL